MPRHPSSVTALGWEAYLGATDTLVSHTLLGRYPVKVQEILSDALRAMETVLVASGYENPCDYIGSYLKRIIRGYVPETWSTHSYGIAVDLDYGGDNPDSPDHELVDNNPHLHDPIERGDPRFGVEFQLLEHQVDKIEAIKNLDGEQIWRWLGWPIGDTMHFQANVAPRATTVDWSTVYTGEQGEDEVWIRDITDETWAQLYEDGHIEGNPDVMPDYYFADGPATDAERLNAYNKSIQSMSKTKSDTSLHTHPVTTTGHTGGPE